MYNFLARSVKGARKLREENERSLNCWQRCWNWLRGICSAKQSPCCHTDSNEQTSPSVDANTKAQQVPATAKEPVQTSEISEPSQETPLIPDEAKKGAKAQDNEQVSVEYADEPAGEQVSIIEEPCIEHEVAVEDEAATQPPLPGAGTTTNNAISSKTDAVEEVNESEITVKEAVLPHDHPAKKPAERVLAKGDQHLSMQLPKDEIILSHTPLNSWDELLQQRMLGTNTRNPLMQPVYKQRLKQRKVGSWHKLVDGSDQRPDVPAFITNPVTSSNLPGWFQRSMIDTAVPSYYKKYF
jgi:hypothetical protein